MGLMTQGYKGTITFGTDGVPSGVSGVAKASMFDGAIGGLTNVANDTFYTGAAKTGAVLGTAAVAILGTSKFTTDSWVPRRAGQ